MKSRDPRALTQLAPFLLIGVFAGLLISGLVLLTISGPRGAPISLAEPQNLRIHVAGEVNEPGVYELPFGSIVQDAIEAAGGLSEDAGSERINLASGLENGQQVYVPVAGNSDSVATVPGAGGTAPSHRVPINTATEPELERLPGIGPVIAQRLVEHRQLYGPYQRAEDLLNVEGIGPAKLDGLRDYILVP